MTRRDNYVDKQRYCATAFVYCRSPQGVNPLDLDLAIADIGRLAYEVKSVQEKRYESIGAISD